MQRDRFDGLPHFVVAALDRSTIHTNRVQLVRGRYTLTDCRSPTLKHGLEGVAELRVVIAQDKAHRKQSAVAFVDSMASHLHHPILGGMWGDAGERDASRFLNGMIARVEFPWAQS